MPFHWDSSYEQRYSEWYKQMEKLKELKDKGYPVHIYPSPPDERDIPLKSLKNFTYLIEDKELPSNVKLHLSPLVLNQLNSPFCGGASLAGITNNHYDYHGKMPEDGFSMAFAYHMAKRYDGLDDDGTYLRTICKIGQHYGICRESLLPLKDALTKPEITEEMLEDAAKYKIKRYARLETLEEIKEALSSGFYVLIGTIVTDNWNNPPNGFLSLPHGYLQGGHATYGWSYDDQLKGKDRFTNEDFIGYLFGMNSWGNWGDFGKYYMPYKYYYWESDLPGFRSFLEGWMIEFEFQGDNKPPQPQPIPDPPPQPNPTPKTPIINKPQTSIKQAQLWAKNRNAHQRFIDIAPAYWQYGELTGINPEVLYCQSAKETNFGKFTGIVTPEKNNWAGIKTASAKGDILQDFEQFENPQDGVRGHFNHICAYVGLEPIGIPHDRYFLVKKLIWAGDIKFVEELSGKWAVSNIYGESIVNDYLLDLLETPIPVDPIDPDPDNPKESIFVILFRAISNIFKLFINLFKK